METERERESGQAEVHKNSDELTLDGLQRASEELRQKVAEMETQKKKHIETQISEHDALIEEARKRQTLSDKANDTVEYFRAVNENGLLDEEGKAKLKELEKQVVSIESDLGHINNRIKSIYEQPEIGTRIVESAEMEKSARTAEEAYEKAVKELELETDKLEEVIINHAQQTEDIKHKIYENGAVVRETGAIVYNILNDARGVLRNKPAMKNELIYHGSESPRELIARLKQRRKELGLFQGREKAAIDLVLKHEKEFEAATAAQQQDDALNNTFAELVRASELTRRYRELMDKAKIVDTRFTNIKGTRMLVVNHLSYRLRENLLKEGGEH